MNEILDYREEMDEKFDLEVGTEWIRLVCSHAHQVDQGEQHNLDIDEGHGAEQDEEHGEEMLGEE